MPTTTKIFFFETSPGTHTIVGAATVEEARDTIGESCAYCTLIGWVPADELCIITGTFVPSVLLPVEEVTPMTIEEAEAFWKGAITAGKGKKLFHQDTL